MAGEVIITVVGNLANDPELKTTQSGLTVVSLNVASTPRTFNRNTSTWDDGETVWVRCTAWRELAENISRSLTKGTRVIVTGRLKAQPVRHALRLNLISKRSALHSNTPPHR